MEILIGADPELFLKKNGRFHSAHGIVPGSKETPFPVKNGAVQVDGMALEINISPSKNKKEFVHNISSVLHSLREMVPDEYVFDYAATAEFSDSHMREQPREALMLGCDADFDAYNECQSPRPAPMANKRTAGGHIHIGWTENEDPMESSHFLSCCQIAKQLDYFLGIPSVILDRDEERQGVYGGAGSFRPKPYGMEYRVLSNFWIRKKEYMGFVFSQTMLAFDLFVNKGTSFNAKYGRCAYDIVRHKDKNGAKYFIENIPEAIGEYSVHHLIANESLVK